MNQSPSPAPARAPHRREQGLSRLPSLRRELLVPFVILFSIGVMLAGLAGFMLAPLLPTPRDALAFVTLILVGDLVVIFAAGQWILRRTVLDPVERMASTAGEIASGRYRARMEEDGIRELDALSRSVNEMADRLLRDQDQLSENVRSLDMTNRELVEARDELIRAARLASVGTLASGLAHEIGNPLGAMMAYLDLARSRAGDSAEAAELIASARTEARRIDAIVRSLLEYARPSLSAPGPFDPGGVVGRVRELLEAQGRLDGVEVVWPTVPEAAVLKGNPQHLEQILLNLVLNALDAMEGTSSPQVEVKVDVRESQAPRHWFRRASDPPTVDYAHRRRLAMPDPGAPPTALTEARHVLQLEVRDSGPGIPPEHIDSLFDPFFTTKDPGKGTGLGLAICQRLAESLGGTIEADNHEGGGARFLLRFPIAD